MSEERIREGSLEAPTRHPIEWRSPEYYDRGRLEAELERVFDICHGCRRCVNLCNAFPTLFDLVDESPTMEVDGVAKEDYHKVVEHCYLCDLCYMTKCPYVPPHPWNVDFPHLMLRAKAVHFREHGASLRDRVLSATDEVGRIAGIPVVAQVVNAVNHARPTRKLLEKTFGVHHDAVVPDYHTRTAHRRLSGHASAIEPRPTEDTRGRVAIFTTCYGDRNQPQLVEDLVAVLEHNGIAVTLVPEERCCGMPKLELGDLDTVAEHKEYNLPRLMRWVDEGWDIMAPIPSCVLMFRQELPLMFPDDEALARLRRSIFDPFEYLSRRHRAGLMNTDFRHGLGRVAYHAPCHQRVQNIGPRTREILELVPDTEVELIERCSGHDGTYAVKREYHDVSMKIGRPVFRKVAELEPDHYTSDCPMAAAQIGHGSGLARAPESPFRLLRLAYGI